MSFKDLIGIKCPTIIYPMKMDAQKMYFTFGA
jgi:hypothetical protein